MIQYIFFKHAIVKYNNVLTLIISIFSSSRIGLDWACTVADILHRLNACPEWSPVIAAFSDHCVNQLPQTLKRTNLFTLLVLVGFPQVRKQSYYCQRKLTNKQKHFCYLNEITNTTKKTINNQNCIVSSQN